MIRSNLANSYLPHTSRLVSFFSSNISLATRKEMDRENNGLLVHVVLSIGKRIIESHENGNENG